MVTKEPAEGEGIPCSYTIHVYRGCYSPDDNAIIGYDSNTINLRAATEFIAMVSQRHYIEAEDVHFDNGCYDLELSWRCYNELR